MSLSFELGTALSEGSGVDWTEQGGKGRWVARAKYANGQLWGWVLQEKGDKVEVSVVTDGTTYVKKKPADSLKAAQRFASKYIERADGGDMLTGGDLKKFFGPGKK